MNIAFSPIGGEKWTGGMTYLEYLLNALYSLEEVQLKTILYVPKKTPSWIYDHLLHYISSVVYYYKPNRWSFEWCLRKTLERTINCNILAYKIFAKKKIDLIFLGSEFGKHFPIPTIGWIPDFQHIHLPEMFSKKEWAWRNKLFLRISKNSTRIILSSKDALKDFQSFAPKYVKKANVVSFVAYIPDSLYLTDPIAVCDEYDLNKKFVYIPNQFWKHKNHIVVFESLRILKSRGKKIFIVCTGNLTDNRNPKYFYEIIQLLSDWKIQNQVAILGLVPHKHVFSLMRQSICVLNPSFFEGWNTCVEEAKSIGKRVVLSNINVHKEQNPPKAIYFDPTNAEELACKLADLWDRTPSGPDKTLEEEARELLSKRIRQYGATFLKVANSAIQDKN